VSIFTEKEPSLRPSPPAEVSPVAAHGGKSLALSLREADRAVLRPVVAELENELASLLAQANGDHSQAAARVTSHWRRLVEIMALGTPPELRSCPHCGYGINATATRCIQCWKQSEGKPRGLT
jgi:hypothetical protein